MTFFFILLFEFNISNHNLKIINEVESTFVPVVDGDIFSLSAIAALLDIFFLIKENQFIHLLKIRNYVFSILFILSANLINKLLNLPPPVKSIVKSF